MSTMVVLCVTDPLNADERPYQISRHLSSLVTALFCDLVMSLRAH